MEIRHILCPVDLSPASMRALGHASALAGWYESALTAFHVETARPVEEAADFEGFALARSPLAGAVRSARALEDVRVFVGHAACVPSADIVVEESTHIEHAIVEAARRLPADLIVMGSHGRAGITRLLLGSVAERVLRAAPCPVMVVPPHDDVPPSTVSFKHIVCAIDFSESSLAAVSWALSMAQEADAQLALLHVVEVPPELSASAPAAYGHLDELRAAVRADTLVCLRALIPCGAASFCSVETATASGAAGHAILDFAAEGHADLIVMGAQGHGAVDRLIFGSKTRDVIRGAGCPVLTVRHDPFRSQDAGV